MSILRQLNIKLGADITPLEMKMSKASRLLRREGRNWTNLGNELSAALTLPLIGIGVAAVKSAADMGKYEDGLVSVMGSADAAKKELALLRQEAEKPGLDFEQAIKGSVRLQNVEFSAESARKTLAAFGNAIALAGGSASDLDGVTLALTQIQSKGKVSAEEINQLAERVPQIRMAMKGAFGTADTEVLQKMTLSTEQFIEGVVNELNKLPQATSGINNEIVNTFTEMRVTMASIGKDIYNALDLGDRLASFRDGLRSVSAAFSALDDGQKKAIVNTALTVAAIGPALKAYGLMKTTVAGVIDLHRSGLATFKKFSGGVLSAAESFRKMDMVMKATTIGLVLAGVTALVLAYKHLNSQMSTAEKIQASVNSVSLDAEYAIVKERLAAKDLIETLTDENATREQKKRALDSLNAISPEYFSNLSIEKSSVDEINTAYDAYIDNLLKAARAKASQQKIIELEKERIRLLDRLGNAKDGIQSVGEAWDVLLQGSGGRLATTLKSQISAIEEQQQALAKLSAEANNVGSPISSSDTTSEPVATKSSTATKAAKEERNILAELGKTYELIAKKSQIYGTEMDANAARSTAVRDAINELLEQGLTPQDERIAMLTERYRNLNLATLETGEIQTVTLEPVLAVNEALSAQGEKVNEMSDVWRGFGETIAAASEAAEAAMVTLAAAGETSYKKLGKAALKAAADAVRSALMTYVANVIKDTGIISGPLAPILAPAAGAAAGVAFNSIIKGLKIPALAEGAIVSRPTLALIGEKGPEIVAPPQKLPGLATMMGKERQGRAGAGFVAETRIKGSDLIVLVREAALAEQRRTGNSFLLNF